MNKLSSMFLTAALAAGCGDGAANNRVVQLNDEGELDCPLRDQGVLSISADRNGAQVELRTIADIRGGQLEQIGLVMDFNEGDSHSIKYCIDPEGNRFGIFVKPDHGGTDLVFEAAWTDFRAWNGSVEEPLFGSTGIGLGFNEGPEEFTLEAKPWQY